MPTFDKKTSGRLEKKKVVGIVRGFQIRLLEGNFRKVSGLWVAIRPGCGQFFSGWLNYDHHQNFDGLRCLVSLYNQFKYHYITKHYSLLNKSLPYNKQDIMFTSLFVCHVSYNDAL